jgi:HD superfamily phosphodiesterase
MNAAAHIEKLFGKEKTVSLLVSKQDSVSFDQSNIITLGSAPANEESRILLDSLDGLLKYEYSEDRNLIVNGELFRSEYREDVLVKDYALICKGTNPFSSIHKFLVFSGNHGIGTQGSVIALTSESTLHELAGSIGKANFYAVVEVTADSRFAKTPTNIRIARCGLLPNTGVSDVKSVIKTREERLKSLLYDIGAEDAHIKHAFAVTRLAMRIANASQSNGTDVDTDAVYFGSMLHDIGRTESDGIDHGIRGNAIVQRNRKRLASEFSLMPDTIDRISEAIECHIVGGIPKTWIEAAKLKLPHKDYVPQCLEAKIVALSDQLMHRRDRQDSVLKEAPNLDIEVFRRIFGLTREVASIVFDVQTGTSI